MRAIRERVVRFGAEVSMVGVVTDPPSDDRDTGVHHLDRPAVLVLNAGFVHRAGPFRMNVELARALAASGYPTMRLDLSGLGDSPARAATGDLEHRVRADIGEAIAALQEATGATRVVLYGLCSGAMNAHFAGTDDRRVAGLMLVDPYAWSTPKFYLRRYGPALRDPERLGGFAKRAFDKVVKLARAATPSPVTSTSVAPTAANPVFVDNPVGSVYLAEWPPADRIAHDLTKLLGRGARALMVYTGGMVQYFNYAEQLQDALPSIDLSRGVTVEYWPDTDHTLTAGADRQRLIDRMLTWLGTL